jgi:hypothetical protein
VRRQRRVEAGKRVNGRLILFPVLAQVLLTLVVYVRLNAAKIGARRRGEVDLQRRALHDDAWPDSIIKINNNIRNQFELPVLFYVLAFALLALDAVTGFVLAIATLFVLSRIVHAWVHLGSNHVPARRRAFLFGCAMVLLLAVTVACDLVAQLIVGS